MRNLVDILSEGFYKNTGANDYLTNAITVGQDKIIKYGINLAENPVLKMTAEITKNTSTSIHVKVKGFRLSRMEFDIDFAEYEAKLKEFARGKFSNLEFRWYVCGYYRDRGIFVMKFTNTNTNHDYFLNYNVDSETLTRF